MPFEFTPDGKILWEDEPTTRFFSQYLPKLNNLARNNIWKTLLSRAGVDPNTVDVEELAEIDINGREISQSIRVDSALAATAGRPVQTRDLKVSNALSTDLLSSRERGA